MSELHVRQLQTHLHKTYDPVIDLTDVAGRPAMEKENHFLTRALSMYVLCTRTTRPANPAYIVDGYEDNGIDAVLPDSATKQLYLIQSKWIKNGSGEPGVGELSKFITGINDLVGCKFERFNTRLQTWKRDLLDLLMEPQCKIHVIIAYTGDSFGPHSQRLIDDLLLKYNDISEVIEFERLSLRELHRSLVLDVKGNLIDADIALHNWGALDGDPPAYYGYAIAADLKSLWDQHGDRLFAENLRSFMHSTDVNTAISNTLVREPEKFFYLNNGITILAHAVKRVPIGSGDNKLCPFHCEGLSIINGAQTMGCIGSIPTGVQTNLSEVKVLCRILSIGDCGEEFSGEVTRACNNQNAILSKDFAALDEHQRRLDIEFSLIGKRYVYRSGELAPTPDAGLTFEEAAVTLACAHEDVTLSTQAKREVGRLWADTKKRPYTQIFNNQVTADRLWTFVCFMRRVEARLNNRSMYSAGALPSVAIHANRFIPHILFKTDIFKIACGNLGKPEVEDSIYYAVDAVLDATAQQVATHYPDAYVQSTFKNQTRTRDLENKVMLSIQQNGSLTEIQNSMIDAAQ